MSTKRMLMSKKFSLVSRSTTVKQFTKVTQRRRHQQHSKQKGILMMKMLRSMTMRVMRMKRRKVICNQTIKRTLSIMINFKKKK